jgi:hypothetical protein
MPILNYTTKIDAYKTIYEIQKILSSKGANKITIDNDNRGLPIALTFCIYMNDFQTAFCLPCNFNGVLKAMKKNNKVANSFCNEDQALRVGWRIIKDWVEAQMAIVESELADLAEVFLPYAITKDGNTLYDKLKNNQNLLS